MTNPSEKSNSTCQPGLSALFADFLFKQMRAEVAGLLAPPTGEVVPYEAAPAQPADPKLAWEESLAALPFYSSKLKASAKNIKAPPDWPALVSAQEPQVAVPFCLGNFPQIVRSLQPLLQLNLGTSPAKISNLVKPTSAPSGASAELIQWADRSFHRKDLPENLLAVAVLRLARDFDRAESLLSDKSKFEEEFRSAWENERAALSWHRGRTKEALDSWLAQPESIPVLFNRGMACLFLNRRAEAPAFLNKAIAHLSDDDAWFHLARLYLAVGEM